MAPQAGAGESGKRDPPGRTGGVPSSQSHLAGNASRQEAVCSFLRVRKGARISKCVSGGCVASGWQASIAMLPTGRLGSSLRRRPRSGGRSIVCRAPGAGVPLFRRVAGRRGGHLPSTACTGAWRPREERWKISGRSLPAVLRCCGQAPGVVCADSPDLAGDGAARSRPQPGRFLPTILKREACFTAIGLGT